jgi:two-component system, OmpR family, sensor kinase
MTRRLLASAKRLLFPRSLRNQLLSRSLSILGILLLLIGGFQYFIMKDFLYRNKAEALRSQISQIPKDLLSSDQEKHGPDQDEPPQSPNKNRRPFLLLPDTTLAFIDKTGSLTNLSEDSQLLPPLLSKEEYAAVLEQLTRRKEPDYRIVTNEDGLEHLVVFRTAAGYPDHSIGPPVSYGERPSGNSERTLGIIQVSFQTEALQDMLMQQLMIFFALSSFALIAGLVVSLPVIRRTLVPLSNIGSAVHRTDAGNLSERLPAHQGQEEIDRLSVSFNGMLERLETSFQTERDAKEQMRRFVADASHELRTPLTSIHGFLEILLRGAAEKPEQLYSALNSMYGESRRINKLVEDLLLLAKLDRAPQLIFKEASLQAILKEMEPQLRILAGNRSVYFELNSKSQGQFDPDKIKQVVLNLFHNAVQHTDAETGQILIALSRSENQTELTIKDNGPGIPPEHVTHVFERFYRSESSRTRRSGGAGLGLSITKSIVEAHGGTIRVDSQPGEGSAFRILLPLSKKE